MEDAQAGEIHKNPCAWRRKGARMLVLGRGEIGLVLAS